MFAFIYFASELNYLTLDISEDSLTKQLTHFLGKTHLIEVALVKRASQIEIRGKKFVGQNFIKYCLVSKRIILVVLGKVLNYIE